MSIKLFDSELKILEALWKNGDTSAKDLAAGLSKEVGWSKTTTYTVIKKCIGKGAVLRIEPGFVCRALITREQARQAETAELINKMYGGSADLLVASILNAGILSPQEIERLKQTIEHLK